MEGYQEIINGIRVPSIWPCDNIRNQILEAVQNAILHYPDNRVFFTINNVFTELIRNESGIGYDFQRTEEILEDSYKIELILPSEIVLISGEERTDITVTTENLTFHPLDMELVQKTPGRRVITIAVPKIDGILEIRGNNGNLIHGTIFKTTYPNIKIIEISTILRQYTFNDDPIIFVKKITENEVKIICFDKIPAPQWRLREQLDNWIGFSIIATSFLLLMYCLFVTGAQMF